MREIATFRHPIMMRLPIPERDTHSFTVKYEYFAVQSCLRVSNFGYRKYTSKCKLQTHYSYTRQIRQKLYCNKNDSGM